MEPTLYSILGVAPGASQAELETAYEAQAAALRAASARRSGQDAATERALERLDEAWEVLGDPEGRALYDGMAAVPPPRRLHHEPAGRSEDAPDPDVGMGSAPSSDRPPLFDPRRLPQAKECRLCGSTPAVDVLLTSQSGRLTNRPSERRPGPYCRDCGVATFRDLTDHTLVAGWWGPLSFWLSWAAIGTNVAARRHLAALDEPMANVDIRAPLARPLDPGRPLVRRKGILVAAALLVAVVGVLALLPGPERSEPPCAVSSRTQVEGRTVITCLEP